MPTPSLIDAFSTAQERHAAATADLVPLITEMALATIVEVFPGAVALETEGEMNEDGLSTLRIRRVLDGNGTGLYDARIGDDGRHVEEIVDRVGFDYLDVLLDLTGDDYLGYKTVSRPK